MARRAAEIAELCFSAYSAPLRETCKEGLRKNERIALKQVQCKLATEDQSKRCSR
jgi:hypothetical protein